MSELTVWRISSSWIWGLAWVEARGIEWDIKWWVTRHVIYGLRGYDNIQIMIIQKMFWLDQYIITWLFEKDAFWEEMLPILIISTMQWWGKWWLSMLSVTLGATKSYPWNKPPKMCKNVITTYDTLGCGIKWYHINQPLMKHLTVALYSTP